MIDDQRAFQLLASYTYRKHDNKDGLRETPSATRGHTERKSCEKSGCPWPMLGILFDVCIVAPNIDEREWAYYISKSWKVPHNLVIEALPRQGPITGYNSLSATSDPKMAD